MSQDKEINVIVWAYEKENAISTAKLLSQSDLIEENFYKVSFENYNINIYPRYHNLVHKQNPRELIDIVVLYTDSKSSGLAKEYIDYRKGIHFRFTTGQNPGDLIDSKYLDTIDNSARETIFNTAINHDKALREIFNKIDKNSNGLLDRDEIIQVSTELQHELTESDANEIIAILGDSGKINFAQFKHWWQLGRADLPGFRQVIGLKMKLTNFFKDNAENFTNYIKDLTTNTTSNSENPCICKCSILPDKKEYQEFHNTSLNIHLLLGQEYEKVRKDFPLHYNEAFTFGIEIPLSKSVLDQVDEVSKSINIIVKELTNLIPNFSMLQSQGLQLNLRHQGEVYLIEFSIGGYFGDMLSHLTKELKLEQLQHSGYLNGHLSSKISIKDFLNLDKDSFASIKEVLIEIMKLNFECTHTFNKLDSVVDLIAKTLDGLSINKNKYFPNVVMNFLTILRFYLSIRSINFQIDYDVNDVVNNIENKEKDFFSKEKTEVFNTKNIKNSLAFLKSNEQLSCLLKIINLDRISFFITTPIIKLHLKTSIITLGLNELIDSLEVPQ